MEIFSALLALCVGNSPVPVNFPHKGQWRGALSFSLICAWINNWVNNREAGDLRRHCGHYDVNVINLNNSEKSHLEKAYESCVHGKYESNGTQRKHTSLVGKDLLSAETMNGDHHLIIAPTSNRYRCLYEWLTVWFRQVRKWNIIYAAKRIYRAAMTSMVWHEISDSKKCKYHIYGLQHVWYTRDLFVTFLWNADTGFLYLG